jgi:hypothetical protein
MVPEAGLEPAQSKLRRIWCSPHFMQQLQTPVFKDLLFNFKGFFYL